MYVKRGQLYAASAAFQPCVNITPLRRVLEATADPTAPTTEPLEDVRQFILSPYHQVCGE